MNDLLSTLQQASGQTPQDPQAVQSQPASAFDTSKSYGTPSQLLDNLQAKESGGSGNTAVNPKTGAMGPYQFTPSTVADLRKNGVKFDPFDPNESRAAADWYMQKLRAQNGGTWQGALKAYGGFVNADPTSYVNDVMKGVPDVNVGTTPGQSNVGQQAKQSQSGQQSDLLSVMQQAAANDGGISTSPSKPDVGPPPTIVDKMAQGFGDSLYGLGRIAEHVAGPVTNFGRSVISAGLNAAGAPEAASLFHPVSTNDFDQMVASREQQYDQSQKPSDKGGVDWWRMAGGALNPVNYLAPGGPAKTAVGSIVRATAQGAGLGAMEGAGTPQTPDQYGWDTVKGAATGGAFGGGVAALLHGAVSPAVQYVANKVKSLTGAADSAASDAASGASREMAGGGSASANQNPYPPLSGEDTSRGAFPQVKMSKIGTDAPPDEQKVRSYIAGQVLGPDSGIRDSVITGSENTARNEQAAAKSPIVTPATSAMKEQIGNEQNALNDYALARVDATGASQTLRDDYARGELINNAFYDKNNSIFAFFQNVKRAIYNQAKITSGDNPITTTNIDNFLSDNQTHAGAKLRSNQDVLSGANDLINLARTIGFKDADGNVFAPASVGAWDAVRKSLNSDWTPSNSKMIGQLNRAIDQDISAAGGSELYKLGDKIHQAEKTLLGSDGIESAFGEYGANNIKNGTPLEKIPNKLNALPIDQWQHIDNILGDLSKGQLHGAPEGMPPVPPELAQVASAARAEMHGALAREVYQAGANKAGVWNQNSANKVLNSTVGQKILRVFPPDEVNNFHTLNYAGQIMPGVHAYEGAGQQISRLSEPGHVEKYFAPVAAQAGTALGSALGLPGSTMIGAFAGQKVGNTLSNVMAKSREGRQLGEVVNKMQDNANLSRGQSLSDLLNPKGK